MVGCTTAEQDGYTNGYKAMCNWYEQNKNSTPGTCTGGSTSSGIVIPTSTGGNIPSGTAVPTGFPTATCQASTVTVTSTATVTVTAGGITPLPTATPATCNHGSYACEAPGTSAKFTICVWGRYESQMCAPGTVCKTAGNSIICDWA
ncbi:hypothetical protein K7432_001977 [Basidiobolus ranarum]|uniref:Uncharacterized protein n=1 Tax=Basidiobolus ranarum TaxID=34480 RepID=A0ABR2X2B1_9FUNG